MDKKRLEYKFTGILIIMALLIAGLAGYWSGYSSRHISPVEERTPTIEGSGQVLDVMNYFKDLTEEQKNCAENSLGKNVYKDISNAERLPSPDEFEEIKSCTGLKAWPPGGFAHMPQAYEEYEWLPDWEVNKR